MSGNSICDVYQYDCNTIYIELKHNAEHKDLALLQNATIEINKSKTYNTFLAPSDVISFAQHSGYCVIDKELIFIFPCKLYDKSVYGDTIYVACEQSGWGKAITNDKWKMHYDVIDSRSVLALKIPLKEQLEDFEFKFISESGMWIEPSSIIINVVCKNNIKNFKCYLNKTGKHILKLVSENTVSLREDALLKLKTGESFHIDNRAYLYSISSNEPLGAIIENNTTVFRLFAPRAKEVQVCYHKHLNGSKIATKMFYSNDGTWSVEIPKNLHRYYYFYQLTKKIDEDIDKAHHILDPYAKATVSREGPGIVLKHRKFIKLLDLFKTPHIKDAVIVESHIRDILAKAPINLNKKSRLGFSGIRKWLTERSCYFRKLRANFVELMPIQEFDAKTFEEYHWGYMPINFFCPCSCYCNNPANGSQIKEFKQLIRSFHRKHKSVILDVVYNHVGEPNHLKNIDESYYFRHDQNKQMENYSGCGNDLRTESPMVQRLIFDSAKYLVETFNIDGFRFDLAELVGGNFIKFLQNNLQKIKPSLAFILEPWSFRGYIGNSMQNSKCSLWNDEYREFMTHYVCGHGNSDGLKYFLSGSLGHKTKLPYQSVNYVASHDDLGWVDKITENAHCDGSTPTENDCRRTQLALACLMCSIGVPMIPQGMDFMSSKHGQNNTYNREDLNALDYSLIKSHLNTHRYFSRFIKLRLSRHFAMLRLDQNPGENYFKFFSVSNSTSGAMLFNANKTLGDRQLIFAINPHNYEINIKLDDIHLEKFKLYADENCVYRMPKRIQNLENNKIISLPCMSCRVFIS